jgi:hypothetical protein
VFVRVTDINGCQAESSKLPIVVIPLPELLLSVEGVLEFCNGDSVILHSGAVDSCLWSNGATGKSIVVMESGRYHVTVYGAGCMAVSEDIEITVFKAYLPVPVINSNGTVLVSSPADNYQWYMNGNILPNETGQTLDNPTDAVYQVSVTDTNGCVAFSDSFSFNPDAVMHLRLQNSLRIIPNPNSGIFRLQYSAGKTDEILIFNAIGTEIYRSDKLPDSIDLSAQPKGVYILKISHGSRHFSRKLILQ